MFRKVGIAFLLVMCLIGFSCSSVSGFCYDNQLKIGHEYKKVIFI
jgi:hypothetical protein